MKFLGFSKIGEENLWKIFHFKNFFFFFGEIFSRDFLSRFWNQAKIASFRFFFCWVLSVNLFLLKKISLFSGSKLKSREIFLLSDFFPDLIFHLLVLIFFFQILLVPVIKIIKS